MSSDQEQEVTKRSKRTTVVSIKTELAKYNIPSRVKEKVIELAKKLKLDQRKGKPKSRLYYFYITSAYAELGWVYDPKQIMAELGINQKDVNTSEAEYSELQIGYVAPEISDIPESFVVHYLNFLGVGYDYADAIIDYYHLLLENGIDLDNFFPQDICIAVIIKYLVDLGYDFKIKEVCKKFGRKEVKIKDIIKEIELTENK